MRKVTVSRMRERYEQTVLTFRIAYIYENLRLILIYKEIPAETVKTNFLLRRFITEISINIILQYF